MDFLLTFFKEYGMLLSLFIAYGLFLLFIMCLVKGGTQRTAQEELADRDNQFNALNRKQ